MLFRKHGKWTLPILVGVALLAPLTPARAQWTIQTVEEGPSQFGGDVSLAYDPSGNPAIAYMGPYQVRKRLDSDKVKFAHFNGVSWDIEIAVANGAPRDLAYSPLGEPSIVCGGVSFVSKSGSTWNSTTLDTYCIKHKSMLYDNAGNPAVGYFKSEYRRGNRITPQSLNVARRSDGGVWTTQVVDLDVGPWVRDINAYVAMALDAAGNLAIAYSYDTDAVDFQTDTLKFALQNGSSWEIETVETGAAGCGQRVELAYDPLTGRPSVAYNSGQYPTSLGPVFMRKTESGTWERTLVDETVTREVRGCSLAYRPDGTAFLAYGADTGDPVEPFSVKVAWRDPDSGAWTIEVVEQPSDKATFWPSLEIDGNGNLGLAWSQRTSNSVLDTRVKFAHRPTP